MRNDASIFVVSNELAAVGVAVVDNSNATVIVAVSQRIASRITFSLYSPPLARLARVGVSKGASRPLGQ